MKHIIKYTLALLLVFCALPALAQEITQVHGTISDDFGPLLGATVCEIDGNGRIINSSVTDMDGNFTMKVKNQKDKIRFSYVGLKTQIMPINKVQYVVTMENATQLQEVVVKSKNRLGGNALPIPDREVSFAKQTISAADFEGLGINSIDEALQGRIAGLDIIANSGDLGSGSTMRLRGSSSISSVTSGEPLIVVDGKERLDLDLRNFDTQSANNEKFAELLSINTEDIATVTVKKDGAACAIYGSNGANGVIEITTKRGSRGKPTVSYSLNLTAKQFIGGLKLLNGDDYTMLLKESYFNPEQSDRTSNIPEINYDPNFSEYEQYNNNTDWVDAVTQTGLLQKHYVIISGGGEKATFRISGGYDHETGQIIKQKFQRFTTRVNLDYTISDRLRVSTNFDMSYIKNNHNYEKLLPIAVRKMPNMSIYEQDPVTGENTDRYYNMIQSGPHIGSEVFKDDQRTLRNPVAVANLAKNDETIYKVNPDLNLRYEILGMDDAHTRLTWNAQVYMDISNNYTDTFLPSDLVSTSWQDGYNRSYSGSSKSVSFRTKQTLTFIPHFKNENHTAMVMGRFELGSSSSTSQGVSSRGNPSGISSPYAGGIIENPGSSYWEGKDMACTFSGHYSWKGRYNVDATLRVDGTTKFGPDKRWGYFPSVSLRWNVIDEPFMEGVRSWLSMLSIRPSWGVNGNQPRQNYLYTSKYGSTGNYLDMTAMRPLNIRLTDLHWEKTTSYNLGFDLGLLDDRITVAFEVYSKTISDQLLGGFRIPSNSGFGSLAYKNDAKLRDIGWEFAINTNKLLKIGKFSMDTYVNFNNNKNRLLAMDESVLNALNSTFYNNNREILTRVQLNNPFGAIYGFRCKGVYQYQYETFAKMTPEEQINFLADGKTAPVALNAEGAPIYDDKGNPLRMMFAYTNDGTGRNYRFKGGDAIYEDINNDGQINALDIVYLGSSLPKLTGGFGFTFNYDNWRLSANFNYRIGNKILNMARLNMEAMTGNDNQSQAVNYRWRKEGDVTSIPRAMQGNNSNYNTLVSDRFVEDGTFLRLNYLQLSYGFKKNLLKHIGVKRISVYGSANNIFCLTKYTGIDPEISYGGYGAAVDNSNTPKARSYTLGLTVDF